MFFSNHFYIIMESFAVSILVFFLLSLSDIKEYEILSTIHSSWRLYESPLTNIIMKFFTVFVLIPVNYLFWLYVRKILSPWFEERREKFANWPSICDYLAATVGVYVWNKKGRDKNYIESKTKGNYFFIHYGFRTRYCFWMLVFIWYYGGGYFKNYMRKYFFYDFWDIFNTQYIYRLYWQNVLWLWFPVWLMYFYWFCSEFYLNIQNRYLEFIRDLYWLIFGEHFYSDFINITTRYWITTKVFLAFKWLY